jgi:hypothetical protein
MKKDLPKMKVTHLNDLLKVFDVLFMKPMTMKEVDLATGVMRESVCRHVDTLRKSDKLFKVGIKTCTVTGYPYVSTWSTNPKFKPRENQLKLFEI